MEASMYFQSSPIVDEEFEKLYTTYYRPGIAFLISIIKDREEAENMFQDVFLKIWLRREKLDLSLSLQPYIFTSLRNCAFDFLKKMEKDEQMKRNFVDKMQEPFEVENRSEELVSQTVQEAIEKLSDKRKKIIRLNIEEGKSYQEIAQIMRISKNTVKNQLIKAKQHLRNNIDYRLLISQ